MKSRTARRRRRARRSERRAQPANLCVLGLDDWNLEHHLRPLLDENHDLNCRVHGLLGFDEAHDPHAHMGDLLAEAERRARALPGGVQGLFNHWDFPVVFLTPLLADRLGLPGPRPEALFRLEHKYACREALQQAAPEACPPFARVDPFEPGVEGRMPLEPPFWLKPCNAYLAMLGFKIEDQHDYEEALDALRDGIDMFAEPMDELLELVPDHPALADLQGRHCLAEGLIGGRQCTVEGYTFAGETVIYGVVDSYCYPGTSVFESLEYPSRLPEPVQDRMKDVCARLMAEVEFDGGPFNVEFYWDEHTDRLSLLEVNARISQSHANQFRKVDGVSHHRVALDLALGRRPRMPHRQGTFACAAKFMQRAFGDGRVVRVPDEEDLARLRRELPDVVLKLPLVEGQLLSDEKINDSYSYLLSEAFLGGADPDDLWVRWERCKQLLGFQVAELSAAGGPRS